MLQRWFDSGQELQPAHRLAFLGGHARSGTKMHWSRCLIRTPTCYLAEETWFFYQQAYEFLTRSLPPGTSILAGLNRRKPKHCVRLVKAIFVRWHRISANRLATMLVDKNPAFQELIIALVRFFPEIKLLVALRDPRDVVMSCFMLPLWPLEYGNVNYLDLAGTVDDTPG